MALHRILKEELGTQSYLRGPAAPHQKGTVEKTNRRRFENEVQIDGVNLTIQPVRFATTLPQANVEFQTAKAFWSDDRGRSAGHRPDLKLDLAPLTQRDDMVGEKG